LKLYNPLTKDTFQYLLIGKVKEPLATDHFIIHCVADESKVHNISFQNTTFRSICYLVETDLDLISGNKTLDINPYSTVNYKLTVMPRIGGIYSGQITFQDKEDNNKFIWYTLSIHVQRQKPKQMIDLVTIIRQEV
jgi:hypothetical protein